MADAFNKFKSLEESLERTIDLIRNTRSEKEILEKDLAIAQREVLKLQKELTHLHEERQAVRNKVESLVDNIAELTEKRLV